MSSNVSRISFSKASSVSPAINSRKLWRERSLSAKFPCWFSGCRLITVNFRDFCSEESPRGDECARTQFRETNHGKCFGPFVCALVRRCHKCEREFALWKSMNTSLVFTTVFAVNCAAMGYIAFGVGMRVYLYAFGVHFATLVISASEQVSLSNNENPSICPSVRQPLAQTFFFLFWRLCERYLSNNYMLTICTELYSFM